MFIKRNKPLTLFCVGGFVYVLIELLFRGYSHWTMFILGGICFLAIGNLNEYIEWEMPLWKQILIGDLMVLVLEFITGCIVNLWLGWNVWDYSSLPLNLLGQVCPLFALLWMPVVLFGIILDDCLRWLWFSEEKPHYKWF